MTRGARRPRSRGSGATCGARSAPGRNSAIRDSICADSLDDTASSVEPQPHHDRVVTGPILSPAVMRSRSAGRVQQLGRQPLLDDDPAATLLDRAYDAAVPGAIALPPLEEQAGQAAVAVVDPAVLDGRGLGILISQRWI